MIISLKFKLLNFNILKDVRDVAEAHVRAIENDISNGKRYILVKNSYWLRDIRNVLE